MAERLPLLLIVDDHVVIREQLRRFLTRWFRIEAAEAASLAEGRQLAREMRPEIVLVDIGLPDGSGLALASEIRQIRPATRVYLMTAAEAQQYQQAAARIGVGFLSKHDLFEQLVPNIREALIAIGRESSITLCCRLTPVTWCDWQVMRVPGAADWLRHRFGWGAGHAGRPLLPSRARIGLLVFENAVALLLAFLQPLFQNGGHG